LEEQLQNFLRDGFQFIQKFYLEHEDENVTAATALKNMLMLNHNNYVDIKDSKDVMILTSQFVREMTDQECLSGLITQDMKMYSSDIIFKKKASTY